jgi:hypothetical protein
MILLDVQEFNVSPVIPSTLVGLLGLIVGYVYYYLRQKNKNELEKIKELNAEDRPKYLEQKLNDFGTSIDPSDLSPEHKYDLLKRLMNNKLKKYAISAVTLVALSLVVYLVWGKAETDSATEAAMAIASNTFSFQSGNKDFDEKMIQKLQTDSFDFSLNDPYYDIALVTDPPGEPQHTNGSVDGFDYYYDATQVSFTVNDKSYQSEVVVPKTGFSPHISEAEKEYEQLLQETINDNFETIYAEILQVISK